MQNNNNPEKRKTWDPENQWAQSESEIKARQDARQPGEQPIHKW